MSTSPYNAELHHRLQLEREMSDFEVWAAITLTQPWASLMAFAKKLVETRGRRTNHRGWIAIHAAKSFPDDCQRLCHDPAHFWPALHEARVGYPENLPVGEVIAVTRITDCQRTENIRATLTARELAFGDYSDGRFGYVTDGLRMLKRPIPMRGFQSIPWRMPRPITLADLA